MVYSKMKDLEKRLSLVKIVDALASMGGHSLNLDDDLIDELVNKAISIAGAIFLEEEIIQIKKDINSKYKILAMPGHSIVADYEQINWYDERKSSIDAKFWGRYKNFLIDENGFSPNSIATLGDDTLDKKLMNYIGDPSADHDFFKRGLIIGDVQSGKTSTYIGFISKAADAGYKVFILLTGTIESLRKQTQERVEEGFIGINLAADKGANNRVGVGLDYKTILATSLTSRHNDFTGNADKTALKLGGDPVVLVIKKNTTVLRKLKNWLISLNTNKQSPRIELPMLLIDDEADNASINTNADKEDPTIINKLIRELCNVFSKANYVGFTATPFANVFIDPETTEKMATQDLFPEDFIVALPTPSNYIGASKIFSTEGQFRSQLIYIKDAGREKLDGWPFYFKHTKTWRGELPESLTTAIYAFYIANAIRDLRGDNETHRSMLINISRFVMVQQHIKSEIEEIHREAYRSLKYNLGDDIEDSLKDPVIGSMHKCWNDYYADAGVTWEALTKVIFCAMENIQIKIVNSSKSSEKLEYTKNDPIRVIAIGGLALSRGLTLEGLVVSYFYRNTSTYDVLMHMGRWFGYRQGYEDLFRIWTHKDSAEWYAEIADATDILKEDMKKMSERGLRPKNFGIRVRNNSADLNITAYNKMRNAEDAEEVLSYFGTIIETPYLEYDASRQKSNFDATYNFIKGCIDDDNEIELFKEEDITERYIIRDVNKNKIIDYLTSIKTSKFNAHFDTKQIVQSLSDCQDSMISMWDIGFIEGKKTGALETDYVDVFDKKIYKVKRTCIFDSDTRKISLGKRGKLGGPNDGMLGISAYNGKSSSDIVREAKEKFKADYEAEHQDEFDDEKTFPSNTWFKYVADRKPILLIYFIDVDTNTNMDNNDENGSQKGQAQSFKGSMGQVPAVALAIGMPRNSNSISIEKFKYKANKIYNYFERDEILAEAEEE